MRYVTFHPIKNPSDRPFRSGPSPTPVFEWRTLTRSHPLFRLWSFLHLLLARFSPPYAHYATSEATEKGKRRAEGSAEANIGCPGVPESDKDIQPRRGEVQVGASRQVGDLCLPNFVCRSRSRSLAGRKSDRWMFSDEGVYCYVAPFLLVCLPSLLCTVSFLYARTDVRVILFLGMVSCPSARKTRHPDIFISFSLAITCTPSITTCVLTPLGAPVVRVCLTLKRVPTSGIWCCGSTTGFLLSPTTQMDRLFKSKNKRKKSPSPPQLGIPTQIVDRPPGFPTDLGIGPKGRRGFPIGTEA